LVAEIGVLKHTYSLDMNQKARWAEIMKTRHERAAAVGLDEKFSQELLTVIHRHALRVQHLAPAPKRKRR
jgi:hypothetical protein